MLPSKRHRPGAYLAAVGLFALGAWIVATSGCRSEEPPEDFSLRLGESGGFTGWTTGYVLQPSGTVVRFEDKLQGEVVETDLGRLEDGQREELWRWVQASEMTGESPPRSSSGNLTRFLTVTAHGRDYQARWAVQGDPHEPAPLAELYRACREVLQGAE